MGQKISVGDMVKEISKASGKTWETHHVTKDEFMTSIKDRLDGELWLNYLAFVNGQMKRDVDESRRLVPEAEDFAGWLRDSKPAQDKWGLKV